MTSYREETVIQALTDWSLLGYVVRYNALFHPHLTQIGEVDQQSKVLMTQAEFLEKLEEILDSSTG